MAINLQKGQKVSLEKKSSTGLGEILVNLNWNSRPVKQGFLSSILGGSKGIDLDLGCLYELKNGQKGAVQALGNSFGSLNQAPYISLDGDDRTGAAAAGENLRINGNKISEFKRILVYTFIYEGVANWQQADAVVTIKYPGAEDIIVKMDTFNSSNIMCGLALFENQNDQTFSVEKIVQFYNGHQALDKAFNWGMQWKAGRKEEEYMSISLQKGQKVSLSKDNAGLAIIIVGLGWDEVKQSSGKGIFGSLFGSQPQAIDCDASAILLKNGKFTDKSDLVYFGNLKHKSGTVNHMGDNLTGAGDGDDEQIVIDLSKVPEQYDKIVIVVNIYQAVQRKQHFGMIENAFIRLVDARNNNEICKYNLTENYSGMTAMIFGEVYRHNGEWKFSAIGNGTTDPGLAELCRRYA